MDWIAAEMEDVKRMLARLLEVRSEEASPRMAEIRRDRSEVKKLEREEEKSRAEEAKRVVCSQCEESKSTSEFSAHMLVNASKASIACTKCVDAAAARRDMAASKDVKTCVVCEAAQWRD